MRCLHRFLAREVHLKRCQRADLLTVLRLGYELRASQNVDPSMHKVVNDYGETRGHPDSDCDGENDGKSRQSKRPAYVLRGGAVHMCLLPLTPLAHVVKEGVRERFTCIDGFPSPTPSTKNRVETVRSCYSIDIPNFRLTDTDKYIVPLELYGSIVLLLRSDLSSGGYCRYRQQ